LVITYRSERVNKILYYNFIYSFTSISTPSDHSLWHSKSWGTSHSCYNSNTSRATWDPAELNYIRRYYYYYYYYYYYFSIIIYYYYYYYYYFSINNLTVPEILRSIRADEKAIPIFLFRHIENPGRLTHGYRMSKKPFVEVTVIYIC
jgi:hypothetical protein